MNKKLHAILAVVLAASACGKSNGQATDAPPDQCVPGSDACKNPCDEGNDKGVGRFCTSGGGECGKNSAPFIFCTIDYDTTAGVQYCTGPCSKDSDCGANAYCSGSGMGSKGCEPATCGGMPSVDAGVDAP